MFYRDKKFRETINYFWVYYCNINNGPLTGTALNKQHDKSKESKIF